MSEQLISDRFVKLYYNHLARSPEKLEVIYGADSVAKFHDMDDELVVYHGRSEIVKGIKAFHLYNAIANLEYGSIDCLSFSENEYVLTVNGDLTIDKKPRRFNQVFIISRLTSDEMVFYVRSEILTLLPDMSNDDASSAEPELAAEPSAPAAEAPKPAPTYDQNMEQQPRRPYPRRDEYNSYARPQKERVNRPAVEIIFAKNLPDGTTQEDMEAAFSKYGEISQVKMFPEKKYSTVSFKKNDTNYTVHEVYDRICAECPQFTINGEVVRLEPFKLNHRKTVFNNRNQPSQRYHTRYVKQ